MPGSFFDTDVLLYLASQDPAKADKAERIIGNGGTITAQVLNEFANVACHEMRLSWTDTHAFLSVIRGLLPVCAIIIAIHETGLALAERYGISIYDATIAASTLHTECDALWSEGMQQGMVIDSRLRVANRLRILT